MTRLHLVGLPHTEMSDAYSWCAFSQKVRKFSTMMTARGHDTFLYGVGAADCDYCEYVECWSELPPNGYIPEFSTTNPWFLNFNNAAITELAARLEPHDIICLIAGLAQQPIKDAFPDHLCVEYGVGYGGIIPDAFHIFESETWRALVTGALAGDPHAANGAHFDAVIPNYWDAADFPDEPGRDDDYLLYIGRLISRKGVQEAVDTARITGRQLHVAGPQGDFQLPAEPWINYHGVVGPAERAVLMRHARAVMVPTRYVEPFGGVAAEAQLCGTPVVSTDFGAFVETVEQGVSGFRCHTLGEFARAVDQSAGLDRAAIMRRAQSLWTFEAVGPQYDAYLERLGLLWGDGFYSTAGLPAAAIHG